MTGLAILLLATTPGPIPALLVGAPGIFLLLAAWPLALVHLVVFVFKRPRLLIPPPFREQHTRKTRQQGSDS